MDYVNEFFSKTHYYSVRPRICLNSGESLSVQAGKYHYSTPREVGAYYTAVEVFRFSKSLNPYIVNYYTNEDEPLAYVPVWIINRYIEDSGGINYEETFRGKI